MIDGKAAEWCHLTNANQSLQGPQRTFANFASAGSEASNVLVVGRANVNSLPGCSASGLPPVDHLHRSALGAKPVSDDNPRLAMAFHRFSEEIQCCIAVI